MFYGGFHVENKGSDNFKQVSQQQFIAKTEKLWKFFPQKANFPATERQIMWNSNNK